MKTTIWSLGAVSAEMSSANPPVSFTGADPPPCEGGDRFRVMNQQLFGCLLDGGQQLRVTHQVRDAHFGKAGLACAEEFALAAQFEIATRDLDAIVGLAHDIE